MPESTSRPSMEFIATKSSATNAAPLAEGDARMETAQKAAARDIHEFIQNTRSGALGVIGMLLLIYVAIQMLASIESTFNDIWGVTRGRNLLTQIQLYSTAIMLGPLLLVAALGLAGGSQFQSAKDYIAQTPVFGKIIFQILPLLVLYEAGLWLGLPRPWPVGKSPEDAPSPLPARPCCST